MFVGIVIPWDVQARPSPGPSGTLAAEFFDDSSAGLGNRCRRPGFIRMQLPTDESDRVLAARAVEAAPPTSLSMDTHLLRVSAAFSRQL